MAEGIDRLERRGSHVTKTIDQVHDECIEMVVYLSALAWNIRGQVDPWWAAEELLNTGRTVPTAQDLADGVSPDPHHTPYPSWLNSLAVQADWAREADRWVLAVAPTGPPTVRAGKRVASTAIGAFAALAADLLRAVRPHLGNPKAAAAAAKKELRGVDFVQLLTDLQLARARLRAQLSHGTSSAWPRR